MLPQRISPNGLRYSGAQVVCYYTYVSTDDLQSLCVEETGASARWSVKGAKHSVNNPDVVVVAAGIVGAYADFYLAKAGLRTLVIERMGVAQQASLWNPGGLNPCTAPAFLARFLISP
jgi:hypothetical protein